MKILAFAASHRPASLNRQLLNVAVAYTKHSHPTLAIETQPFDFFDLPLFNDAVREESGMPPHADTICAMFAASDALVIAAPEYNWSIPAGLKNILDWISCYRPVPLQGKAAFLMCATPSERGGMLGLTHLKTTLEGLGTFVYPTMFGLGQTHISLQEGAIREAKKRQQLHDQLDGFVGYAKALQRDLRQY